MTEGLSKKDEIEHNEIAAKIIARQIGSMLHAWVNIDSVYRHHPDAPVGKQSWDNFRYLTNQMNALIKSWDKQKGSEDE